MVKPYMLSGVVMAATISCSKSFIGPSLLMRTSSRPAKLACRSACVDPIMAMPQEPNATPRAVTETAVAETVATASTLVNPGMVMVNADNTQFSAGLIGGITGLFLGGPCLAVALSIMANVGSKQDNPAGEIARVIGKSGIEVVNLLRILNDKHGISGTVASSLEETVNTLKSQRALSRSIQKVEKKVEDLASRARQLSSNNDLPKKVMQVLGTVGNLTEAAITNGMKLETEYRITDTVAKYIKAQFSGVS